MRNVRQILHPLNGTSRRGSAASMGSLEQSRYLAKKYFLHRQSRSQLTLCHGNSARFEKFVFFRARWVNTPYQYLSSDEGIPHFYHVFSQESKKDYKKPEKSLGKVRSQRRRCTLP
jgi:hypothetical protein